MANSGEYEPIQGERRLSEAQRQHLMPMIRAWQAAAAKLDALKRVTQAQIDLAQAELDDAQDTVNTFVRYCGTEHQIPFDIGQWDFDVNLMCFVRIEQEPQMQSQLEEIPQKLAETAQPVNGTVEHAQNAT